LVITASDYRVSTKTGHHALTFEIAGLILGERFQEYLDFFDVCRRKRNIVDYDLTDLVRRSKRIILIQLSDVSMGLLTEGMMMLIDRKAME